MDVILTEVENGKSKFIFPSLPEEVKGTNRTNYQSYDILSYGEVKIPKGMKLTEISFDGIFFGAAKRNESIVKQWVKPAECEKILKNWQEKGTVLRLMVTETNVNIDVTISSFECTDYGGYGNKKYSLEFVQYRSLKVYTTDELKIVKFVKKTITRPAPLRRIKEATLYGRAIRCGPLPENFTVVLDRTGQRYTVQTNRPLSPPPEDTGDRAVTMDTGFTLELSWLSRTRKEADT